MEYEIYGLTEEEWNTLSEEERGNYRGIGEQENASVLDEEDNV